MSRPPRMSAVLMLCAMVVLPFTLVLAEAQPAEYLRGFEDGQREGRNRAGMLHFLWGFLTMGIHTLAASLSPSRDVPIQKLVPIEDESLSYRHGFVDGYEDGYRRQRLRFSLAGAAMRWVLGVIGLVTASS